MTRDMSEKLSYLKTIRREIGEEQFKFAAASITATHYIESMKQNGKRMNRMQILIKVNTVLQGLGCEEISYGFLRKFV